LRARTKRFTRAPAFIGGAFSGLLLAARDHRDVNWIEEITSGSGARSL